MQVRDVMMPAVGSVHTDDSLRDAMEKLKALDLDPLPVVDGGRVVGLLYEGAVVKLARQEGLAVGSEHVRDAMSPDNTCCFADQDLDEAITSIERSPDLAGTRRIPVLGTGGQLAGVVSLDDLRKRRDQMAGAVDAVEDVASIDSLASFEGDRVDYMSDESFPASDPMPPPSALGGEARDNSASG
jgi:CBS domain-containing protein